MSKVNMNSLYNFIDLTYTLDDTCKVLGYELWFLPQNRTRL